MMGVIMATDMGRHMADLNEIKAILVVDENETNGLKTLLSSEKTN